MKQFKNLISFLTIICCLSGSILPAYAAGGGTGVPTATFINEPNNSPDLYVSKQVESAAEGYTAPAADLFQFILTDENGQPIRDQEYQVIDEDLGEVAEYRGRYSDQNLPGWWTWIKGAKITNTTGDYGIFTLRAGQTACFKNFGARKYKVTESSTYLTPKKEENGEWKVDKTHAYCDPEGNFLELKYEYEEVLFSEGGYSCKSPAGGSTPVSEVLSTGSAVTFTNRYVPEGAGGKAELRVSKEISFLKDYDAPDTPDFWFSLQIKGQPCVDEAYTIVGAKAGENAEGKTDNKGRFSIKGGQTAVFSQIPADADYKVTEIPALTEFTEEEKADMTEEDLGKVMPEGWWPIGETSQEGSTGNSLVEATFNNTNVSFGVMKTLTTGQKTGEDFTFRLTDEWGNARSGETYLRYTTDGKPVYTEEEYEPEGDQISLNGKVIATDTTGPDGTFILKPGEAAVFIGMKPGDQYQVRELASGKYVQIQPIPPAEDSKDDIYTVSGTQEPQMLHYVNQPIPKGTLNVTKTIQIDSEDTLTEDEFHFVLYRELRTYKEVKEVFGGDATAIDEKITAALNKEGNKQYIAVPATEAEVNSWTAGTTEDSNEYLYTANDQKYRIYATVEKAIYSVQKGLETWTYATGPNSKDKLDSGEFVLDAEHTAVFKDLLADRKYLVRETKLTTEYKEQIPTTDSPYVTIALGVPTTPSTDGTTAEVKGQNVLLTTEAGASFVFTNKYMPDKIDLYLHKTDGSGTTSLEGAEFALYLTQSKEGDPILPTAVPSTDTGTDPAALTTQEDTSSDTSDNPQPVRTDANGMICFKNLRAGTYWLYELKAPSGYCLLKEPIKLEIKRTAVSKDPATGEEVQGSGLEVLINGRSLADSQKYNNMIGEVSIVTSTTEGTNDRLNLTVKNTDLYELPNSGGIGIYWYTIIGTLLMLAAVLILYKNNRQRRC